MRRLLPVTADEVLEIRLAKTFILNKQLYAPLFAHFGVETYEWHALMRLAADDGVTQVELARLMLRDKVAISRLVRDLEAKGLVVRRGDGADTRAKRVHLTARARRLIPRAFAAYRAVSRRAHRVLTPETRAQLERLLETLQRGYREAMQSVEKRRIR